MGNTGRTVKHFSLHRIAGTELRVIADVETGVLPLIYVEEGVIRGYVQAGPWPHRLVTLLILQDMQPLIRQLSARGSQRPDRSGAELPPGGVAALDVRPVVNVYDLAEATECHVFVNRRAMVKEGYWDDTLAIQGLLAHEHAHPLAENDTIRASRRLQLELSLQHPQSASSCSAPAGGSQPGTADKKDKVHRLVALLAEKLCLYAPREIFANEVTITRGFGEALLYLDRRNVGNAQRSVAGREDLRRQLQHEVTEGNLAQEAANLLLLIGDLKGYLDLSMEVVPFYRTGHAAEAQELDMALEAEVFPYLEPAVPRTYAALRQQYLALAADLTQDKLQSWSEGVLNILRDVLAEKGIVLHYHVGIGSGDA